MTQTISNTEQKETEFDDSLVYEASQASLLEDGKCAACQRQGFPLFLVRKSIVPEKFKSEIDWSKNMVQLNGREPDNAKLGTHKYAYRTLREGYVYIFLEKAKGEDSNKLKLIAYEVTNSGAFRLRHLRDIKGSRPKELPKTSCIDNKHHLKAKFITVDNQTYQKAWIAYSASRWTDKTVAFYENSESKRNERFTIVDLTKSSPIEATKEYQQRSFPLADFMGAKKERYLLEIECDDKEVLDYFDEEQLKILRQKIAAGKQKDITDLKKEISKGVLFAKNISLDNLSGKTTDALLREFDNIFCTASHFNSLKTDGRIDSEFQSVINSYKNKKSHQVTDISAIVVEDSFGLAEELSIQRRQLLAPVIVGLTNNSEEQAQVFESKFNALMPLTKSRVAVIQQEQEQMKIKYPDLAKAMYASNILDVAHNQKYKDIGAFKTPNFSASMLYYAPILNWMKRKIAYLKADARGKAFEGYFNSKQSELTNKPLFYFKPEINYARNQYMKLEGYKEILESSEQSKLQGDNNPCIIFGFYRSENDSSFAQVLIDSGTDEFKEKDYSLYFGVKYDEDKTTREFDGIQFDGLVGASEFAALNQIKHSTSYPHFNNDMRYFEFKKLKYIGMDKSSSSSPPLGDFKKIQLTKEQQEKILSIYNSNKPLELHVNSVAVVEYPEAKDMIAKWKAEKQWDEKESKRLYKDTITAFETINTTTHANLVKYVKDVSQDYFTFCTWLFGDGNKLPFWKHECQPDTLDAHINYLYSLALILDCNYIGNLELEEQSAFFATLFRSKDTIYFYLIEGNKYSLFNVASGNLDEKELELTTRVKGTLFDNNVSITPNPNNTTAEQSSEVPAILDAGNFMIKNHEYITSLSLRSNVNVGAYLKQEIISIGLNNVTKALLNGRAVLDQGIINENILKSMNAFSPGIVKQYDINVSPYKVASVIERMEESFDKMTEVRSTTQSSARMINRQYALNGRGPKYSNNRMTVTSERLEYSYFVYFENDKQRIEYEKKLKLGEKAGTDSKFICDAKNVTQDNLEQAFEYYSKQKRTEAIVDTSISFGVSAFTIIYQNYQLSLLKSRLSKLDDQALITKLSRDITKAHLSITTTATGILLSSLKFGSIYVGKERIYALLGKVEKGLSYVGKVVDIIDSLSNLSKMFTALKRGDTGTNASFIISSIGFVVAAVALFLPISLPVTIVIGLVSSFIALFGEYDDGADWSEMEKWFNRIVFGRFDRNDLLPPYPFTDTGLYLSDQDYYLASRKGQCKLLSLGHSMDDMRSEGKPIEFEDISGKHTVQGFGPLPKGEGTSMSGPYYDLYLNLHLPEFVRNISQFEGLIEIWHKSSKTKTIFTFEYGDGKLNITPEMISLDYLQAKAGDGMNRKRDENYDYLKSSLSEKSPDDTDWTAMQKLISTQTEQSVPEKKQQVSEQQIGLFMVEQFLGRIKGAHGVMCYAKYWPEGKKDEKGNAKVPFIFCYEHNVTSIGEDIANFGEGVVELLLE